VYRQLAQLCDKVFAVVLKLLRILYCILYVFACFLILSLTFGILLYISHNLLPYLRQIKIHTLIVLLLI
jgi:hypothetical protein